ncbi:unnamed protein product, partial [Ectocarpus sp. 12 AP-2014]
SFNGATRGSVVRNGVFLYFDARRMAPWGPLKRLSPYPTRTEGRSTHQRLANLNAKSEQLGQEKTPSFLDDSHKVRSLHLPPQADDRLARRSRFRANFFLPSPSSEDDTKTLFSGKRQKQQLAPGCQYPTTRPCPHGSRLHVTNARLLTCMAVQCLKRGYRPHPGRCRLLQLSKRRFQGNDCVGHHRLLFESNPRGRNPPPEGLDGSSTSSGTSRGGGGGDGSTRSPVLTVLFLTPFLSLLFASGQLP